MIRYDLVCERDHRFDGWFPSSDDFDTQAKRGFVSCPSCNSVRVTKAIMAPAIARGRNRSETAEPVPMPEVAPQAALLGDRERELRAKLRELRAQMLESSVDVGSQFPEEARRIHAGEAEHRAIRGEATPAETRALIEEGVPILPIPSLPDERN